MKWYEIDPKDAVDIDCSKRLDLEPPVNEEGQVCPWPWGPQQLVGAPIGQHHCEYCGAMCMAGVRHPDYTGLGEQYEDWLREEDEKRLADVTRGVAPTVGPHPEDDPFR